MILDRTDGIEIIQSIFSMFGQKQCAISRLLMLIVVSRFLSLTQCVDLHCFCIEMCNMVHQVGRALVLSTTKG